MPDDNPQLVFIDWEDSAQPLAEWRYLDDLGPLEVVQCQSVGFLVHDGDDVKVLAPNVGDLGREHAQACGLMRIPTRCIVRVRQLSLPA